MNRFLHVTYRTSKSKTRTVEVRHNSSSPTVAHEMTHNGLDNEAFLQEQPIPPPKPARSSSTSPSSPSITSTLESPFRLPRPKITSDNHGHYALHNGGHDTGGSHWNDYEEPDVILVSRTHHDHDHRLRTLFSNEEGQRGNDRTRELTSHLEVAMTRL